MILSPTEDEPLKYLLKNPDFAFTADFGHEKNKSLFGAFHFRNQLIWARQ